MMTEFDHSLSERTDSRVAQFLGVPYAVGWEVAPPIPEVIPTIEDHLTRRQLPMAAEEARKLVASESA